MPPCWGCCLGRKLGWAALPQTLSRIHTLCDTLKGTIEAWSAAEDALGTALGFARSQTPPQPWRLRTSGAA